MVKNRNEPCKMIQVLEAVAKIKDISKEELAAVAYTNSCKLFAKLD
jgi:Tat protein secretion system quality control protein TatD with DNase activity